MIVYKALKADNRSTVQKWDWTPYLPKGKRRGRWVKDHGPVRLCSHGFHGWRTQARAEIDGEVVYEMELAEPVVSDHEKAASARARLVREVYRWQAKLLETGYRRCTGCGRTHDGYAVREKPSAVDWTDRGDGHEPVLEPLEDTLARYAGTDLIPVYKSARRALVRAHKPLNAGSTYHPVVPATHEFKPWVGQLDRCGACGIPEALHEGWEARARLSHEFTEYDRFELMLVIQDLRFRYEGR